MPDIATPDSHFLSAAEGWLALGNPHEAEAELNLVSREFVDHPDYLEVWWHLLVSRKDWMTAVPVARKLLQAAPERPSGWLNLAYAIRRATEGGLNAAWDVLLPAFERFPTEPIIAYNLGCYACQLEKTDQAVEWLRIAMKHGSKKLIKAMASEDEDLQSLWEVIAKM